MTPDEQIAALVATAPPLSAEQRARLAGLFRSDSIHQAQQKKAS